MIKLPGIQEHPGVMSGSCWILDILSRGGRFLLDVGCGGFLLGVGRLGGRFLLDVGCGGSFLGVGHLVVRWQVLVGCWNPVACFGYSWRSVPISSNSARGHEP